MTRDPLTGTALPTAPAPGARMVHQLTDDDEIPTRRRPSPALTTEQTHMPNPRKLTQHSLAALKVLAKAIHPMKTPDIAKGCPGTQGQVKTALAALRRKGLATMHGTRRHATFELTPEGIQLAADMAAAADVKPEKPAKPKKVGTFKRVDRTPAAATPTAARTDADTFLAGIASDGSLLLFEGRENHPAIESPTYRIPRDHARALVAFLRTLPDSHELALA